MATAAPLPPGEVQFFDNSGAPLAAGLLYTYIPGTTTPKTTWVDPGQMTPNVNPVNLDAAGRCVLWGSGIYRLQLFSSLGNLIWDQESEATDIGYIAAQLPPFTGDGGIGGAQGQVPAPPAGSGAAQDYLRADGTWGPLRVTVPGTPSPDQAGFLTPPIRTVLTTTTSLRLSDAGGCINYNNGAAGALTVSSDSDIPWVMGVLTQVLVNNLVSSGALTITPAAAVSLYWPGSSASPGLRTLAANGQAVLSRIAANTWNIIGAGVS